MFVCSIYACIYICVCGGSVCGGVGVGVCGGSGGGGGGAQACAHQQLS